MDEPWGYDGPPSDLEARNLYAQTHQRRNAPKPTKPRTGATPEAKVLKACIDYLEDDLDCYVLRTSAGMATIGDRKLAIGRAGCPDLTVCLPNGKYCSVECKASGGRVSDAQQRQHEFIRRRNGIVIIPHSVAELRAGLVAAFGEECVHDWETLGKARRRR